ncbi:MAG: 30S ribosomal protein S20 [Candidatus Zixiibacteriota bacterium]|nr:MAG: 30S ribosomal protein S20 [candidate division Zixibacteria bacterium]
MPNHKSCKKRMKSSAAERERNRAMQSHMRKSIKALQNCKTRTEADNLLNDVVSLIDKAAKKRVIHKKKAARHKSKLTSYVRGLSG